MHFGRKLDWKQVRAMLHSGGQNVFSTNLGPQRGGNCVALWGVGALALCILVANLSEDNCGRCSILAAKMSLQQIWTLNEEGIGLRLGVCLHLTCAFWPQT